MADHDHTEHKHGTMDVRDHERTFAGFIKFTTWSTVFIFAILILMALANS